MSTAAASEFKSSLVECIGVLKKAGKGPLSPYSRSSDKIRSKLAVLKKTFLKLRRDYPKEQFPSVAFKLTTIEPLIEGVIEIYPSPHRNLVKLLHEIKFKVESELDAEIEVTESKDKALILPSFLPDDLIEERYHVLTTVLWEINKSYKNACYNSCAAMVRRLVETLIIDAYERHNLRDVILDSSGDFLGLKGLIGKAAAQPEFKLTRETKRLLPDIKFFGDLGVHNRMSLVRKQDLDRLHIAIRIAVEELSRNI